MSNVINNCKDRKRTLWIREVIKQQKIEVDRTYKKNRASATLQ